MKKLSTLFTEVHTVTSSCVQVVTFFLFLIPRKAVEELLKEAKRGRTRAETMGAMGW